MLSPQTLQTLLQASDSGSNFHIFDSLPESDIAFLENKRIAIFISETGVQVCWGDLMLRDYFSLLFSYRS